MVERYVRLKSVAIENYKNVRKGFINCENGNDLSDASIVGIYGQNGSGKTTFIDAVGLLKFALCGQPVPAKYAGFVNVDAESSRFCFQFAINLSGVLYDVWYEFSIAQTTDDTEDNMQNDMIKTKRKAEIFDEMLSFALSSATEKIKKGALIDTRTSGVVLPAKRWAELVGKAYKKSTDLLVTQKYARTTSRSFIFSREMMDIFHKNCSNRHYLALIEALVLYGNRELFVINTENSGLISMSVLPLAFRYKEKENETYGRLALPLPEDAIVIPADELHVVKNVTQSMNIVLQQIVPGLTADIEELGTVMLQDGAKGSLIQLVSLKNGKKIPLQYESEGIKKIISILQLLIVVYNNPSITVAVDELDSGVFEYLLGELLRIISEKGVGQLIFTSHNLRPLETIDKNCIVFTTINPNNRYVRMANVKSNNNLRDFYYRNIVLGGQDEQLYDYTNNYEIALAFKEAGETIGQ